jgi:ABC-type branched-subunit amino acid transport system substrate-binding protein
MTHRRSVIACAVVSLAINALLISSASAQKKYDPGATDTEIKIGNITPYSGPASAYGTIGKAEAAYFEMINAEGGINGRKIKFISVDDAYAPSKTVEQARKLVEQDEVLLLFSALGTAQNTAIQKYMNAKKVPQLFVNTGATRFCDPKGAPWTMGWQPTYQVEGRIYAKLILAKPNPKVAILYQNDDFGKDVLKGLLDGLGARAKDVIVAQATFEPGDPTIDSQIVNLQNSGADVFVNIATPKAAAQAIRKVAQLGWKPTQYVARVSISIPAVIKPAGAENAVGVMSAQFVRDPADPSWHGTPEYAQYQGWFKKYYPEGDINDSLNVIGYLLSQTLVQVLKQAGDNLTRENVMKQAASLNMNLPLLYPGLSVKTSADDFCPIKGLQPIRFSGTLWEPVGPILSGQ